MKIYQGLIAVILLLFGAAMFVGGIWLAMLGGSWFYIVSGVATGVTGLLLFSAAPFAFALYGLTLIGTLIWALWESGADWWALAPRGAVPVVLGILMLPILYRQLRGGADQRYRAGAVILYAALVISGGIALYTSMLDPHDKPGQIAEAPAKGEVKNAGVPDGDWQAYGRTSYGQRYSPLDKITPARSVLPRIRVRRHMRSHRSSSTTPCISARRLRPSSRSTRSRGPRSGALTRS